MLVGCSFPPPQIAARGAPSHLRRVPVHWPSFDLVCPREIADCDAGRELVARLRYQRCVRWQPHVGCSELVPDDDVARDWVPSECDDVIRRASVSINRSSRLPPRESTDGADGVLSTLPSLGRVGVSHQFSRADFSVKNKKLILRTPSLCSTRRYGKYGQRASKGCTPTLSRTSTAGAISPSLRRRRAPSQGRNLQAPRTVRGRLRRARLPVEQ